MSSKAFFPGLDTIIDSTAVWSIYYIHNMYDSLEVGWFFFFVFWFLVLSTLIRVDYVKCLK